MYEASLKDDGQLEDIYKPAIYMDTNFLRCYFISEGAELYFDDIGNEIEPPWEDSIKALQQSSHELRNNYLRGLVSTKDYFNDFGRIRRIVISNLTNASLILTPISLLELYIKYEKHNTYKAPPCQEKKRP